MSSRSSLSEKTELQNDSSPPRAGSAGSPNGLEDVHHELNSMIQTTSSQFTSSHGRSFSNSTTPDLKESRASKLLSSSGSISSLSEKTEQTDFPPKSSGNRNPAAVAEENHELDSIVHIASSLHGQAFTRSITTDDKDERRLDPNSPDFDHRRWAQMALRALDASGIHPPSQGVVFSNLSISGSGSAIQIQDTLLTRLSAPFRLAAQAATGKISPSRRILHSFDGWLESGELLLVLGRPGSGCTTFLKTLCGHLGGLTMEPESNIHFEGIGYKDMFKHYRGEVLYNKEVDVHFPHLTVGQTLNFAAHSRTPSRRPEGLSRDQYVETLVQVVLAVFGLSHTYNTKVGDNFIRGVSGGERKRVSIAEMYLSRCRIGAWDNSTRGLDAASALKFVRSLRASADMGNSCHAIAAYQASQSMYDAFDKVIILYEGHQIYFGPSHRAVAYFEEMGWERPERQVTPDFLTAVTNPGERKARPGMEDKVPRSPKEFEDYWKRSSDYEKLRKHITEYQSSHPPSEAETKEFQASHIDQQARHARKGSPYLLSIPMQVRLCLHRAYQRQKNDVATTVAPVVVQIVLGLVLGSMFYNNPDTTGTFFQRGAACYVAVLINALLVLNEIMLLYSQRPIVEKQADYAFVHPFTEALASMIIDLPLKAIRIACFGVILYFLANFRREPSQFFIYFLFLFTTILTMSGIFRTLGAATKTVGQAMALAGLMVLSIVMYTGFSLPQPSMHPWLSWIRWLNPIYYSFEALIANEFHGREFECSTIIPSYANGTNFICQAVGAIKGQRTVLGDDYLANNYEYYYSHVWRNFGILIGFMIFFNVAYLVFTEFNSGDKSQAEALVFRPGHVPDYLKQTDGVESGAMAADAPGLQDNREDIHLPEQTDVLSWKGLNYDIPVLEGTRRLLDNVNGWVKPGTLTALMGVSGAGKTTLLDVLAQRVSIGVVSGDVLVNGKGLESNFPRRTGYVQQQDMHLETTTVREALQFSAMLRQPRTVSKKEKYDYAEEVIKLLGMEDFAEAVVGSIGSGLNVEQRKLLSIGVELAAKPSLLIFLDEPTSGLDSQSSWTICQFLRRLADHGQAVLATIHQPSALLFQTFDRLLFLAKGGRTVYFGDIGEQSHILLDYFERNGGRACGQLENPAEYMLEIVSGDSTSKIDWVETWNNSPEYKEVDAEVNRLQTRAEEPEHEGDFASLDDSHAEFAMPLHIQLWYVLGRVFQQYYRQPEYIFSKFVLGIISSLYIGFSFWKATDSEQGFQNVLFTGFILCTIFNTLVNQIMPKFVVQRALYEVRERPSRVYSWKVFILSQILVEIPWQIVLGIASWASFYWSVIGTNETGERRALVMLFVIQFFIYAASQAQMVIAALESPALGAMVATLMFGFAFMFNGILQPPSDLPRFWIFMNRVSPFTYYLGGITATALHGRPVICNDAELSILDPPANTTCGDYLSKYMSVAGGQLYNKNATSACEFCAITSADQYLAGREMYYSDRWRNYGIFWAYFVFNICAAIALYYVFRVRTWRKK